MIDIRELERQAKGLDRQIKKYYADEEKRRVQKNEEKYVGRCYKVIDGSSTIYYKILSGLTNNTYCYMHCMQFKLPIVTSFEPEYRFIDTKKFTYEFYGDFLEFEYATIKIPLHKDKPNYTEISVEEFENALREYGKQLIDVSRDDFSMSGQYFKKINELSISKEGV